MLNIDEKFKKSYSLLERYVFFNNISLENIKEDSGVKSNSVLFLEDLLLSFDHSVILFDENGEIYFGSFLNKKIDRSYNIFELFTDHFREKFESKVWRNSQESLVFTKDFFYLDGDKKVNLFVKQSNAIKGLYVVFSRKIDEDVEILKQIEIEEKIKMSIAQDLHDSIGQQLTAIQYYFSTLKYIDRSKAKDVYYKTLSLIEKTHLELRNISKRLLPSILEDCNLKEALLYQIKDAEENFNLQFSFDYQDNVPLLNKDFEVAIYRIFQELISNSVKHGKANSIKIRITFINQELSVVFEDDGKGFDTSKVNLSGMGMKNIHNRVKLFQGCVNIVSHPNQGVIYQLTFALEDISHRK